MVGEFPGTFYGVLQTSKIEMTDGICWYILRTIINNEE